MCVYVCVCVLLVSVCGAFVLQRLKWQDLQLQVRFRELSLNENVKGVLNQRNIFPSVTNFNPPFHPFLFSLTSCDTAALGWWGDPARFTLLSPSLCEVF